MKHVAQGARDVRERAADEKRPYVQKLFTRIAPRYDWFNRLASFGMDQGWRRQAIRRARVGPGARVLDVCAGTGDLAILAARQLGPAPTGAGQGRVVGADLNLAMLQRAQRKEPAITWCQADAERLPFSDAQFDSVTIGFSTRNLGNLAQGLSEMVRVLRPDGRLVILETGYPSNPVLRAGYQAFLFTVARTIGWLLTGSCWPFTYLARSVQRFLTPQQFIAALEQLGARVEYVPLSSGLASLYVVTKP